MKAIEGLIVKSIAGHDKDEYFVITGIIDLKFVLIADGRQRKLLKPKRKSIKHLKLTNTVIDLQQLSDKKLKRVLSDYSQNTVTERGGN